MPVCHEFGNTSSGVTESSALPARVFTSRCLCRRKCLAALDRCTPVATDNFCNATSSVSLSSLPRSASGPRFGGVQAARIRRVNGVPICGQYVAQAANHDSCSVSEVVFSFPHRMRISCASLIFAGVLL